jgi:fatty-acyl-CoA synthase
MTELAATIAEALEGARSSAAELVFHLREGVVRVPAALLLEEARAGAAALTDRGVRPGDAVGIIGPNGPEWARWAYASWLAGAALVPLPYHLRIPDAEALREQIGALSRAARCRAILADPRFLPVLPEGLGMRWDMDLPRAVPIRRPEPGPDDLAVIQFTSGSTAAPKGVPLTHRAILAGVRNSSAGSGFDSRGWVQLSWLPFFHDWGLFGYLVWVVVMETQTHILPTERFAKDPSEWLRLIGEVGATMTPGPTSAWDAALRVSSRRPKGIDLSSLRVCTLAAEAIEPRVLDRLLEFGGELGLHPDAPNGAYGLAEATLAVTLGPGAERIRVDTVDRATLVSTGHATPGDEGPGAKRVVSCGQPVPGTEVRIAGPVGHVPERQVGEILLRGPSLMEGYLGEEHEDPFEDGWLRTGDLGYLADGELYVTGRMKDVVIVMGRNYPSQDLEWAAERVEGVRVGRSVAFDTGISEGEAVVVVESSKVEGIDDLPRDVWKAVANTIGIVPREVIVLRGGSIPFTTSGKLRRSWVRQSYATGELDRLVLARGPARGGFGAEDPVATSAEAEA